ncbi:MAG: hypothetical protein H7831_04440 [Magnetococcus sp. WYHC-3]
MTDHDEVSMPARRSAVSPEMLLWMAVIHRAVDDFDHLARQIIRKPERIQSNRLRRTLEELCNFFCDQDNDKGYKYLCALANLDDQAVLRRRVLPPLTRLVQRLGPACRTQPAVSRLVTRIWERLLLPMARSRPMPPSCPTSPGLRRHVLGPVMAGLEG